MIIKHIALAATIAASLTLYSCSADEGFEEVDLGTTTWHDGFLWTDADTT